MSESAERSQTPPEMPVGEREEAQSGQQPYADVNAEGFLTFIPLDPPTPETAALVADIVDLDHRIHRRLGMGSSDWEEVMGILKNAANMTMSGRLDEARQLYRHAEAVGGRTSRSATGSVISRVWELALCQQELSPS